METELEKILIEYRNLQERFSDLIQKLEIVSKEGGSLTKEEKEEIKLINTRMGMLEKEIGNIIQFESKKDG